MAQNIYDDPNFFAGYARLQRSVHGLDGAPEWPAIQSLLPPLQEARVADLGCGYGWFCREARALGAASVLGLDVSVRMLDKARSMTRDEAIRYERADLENLLLPPNTFNLVYSSLAFHYVNNLEAMLAAIHLALVPGGTLLFTAEHPIYTAPSRPTWLIGEDGQRVWPVNQYQQEGPRVTNWIAPGVIKQHRTLGTWLDALIQQGYCLNRLVEWGPSSAQVAANPALQEEGERPMIFILSVAKAL